MFAEHALMVALTNKSLFIAVPLSIVLDDTEVLLVMTEVLSRLAATLFFCAMV